MSFNKGFRNDLNFGQKYEKLFCELMGLTDFNISKGKFKPYDILDNVTNLKYEVKSDRLGYKTGNIAIEYECSNKPSGITTTEADYYPYFIINKTGYDLYLIPVEVIREKIKTGNRRSVNGGDGYRSKMYLFKISEFDEYKKSDNNINVQPQTISAEVDE